jgi:hypothetical protein
MVPSRRRRRLSRVLITGVAAALAVVTAAGASPTSAGKDRAAHGGNCRQQRVPDPEGPSAEAVSIEGDGDRPTVEAVVYPRPDSKGNPWTQWGQGLALDDGRFISAIGDHLGPDGNSYLFVYDPDTGRITRFADVLSQVDHEDGAWGYGKIHGQIVAGRCGEAYFATYWGTDKNLKYARGYEGDLLFRLDTASLELESLGVPVPQHGIPSLSGLGGNKAVLYGEAPTPTRADAQGSTQGAFFVYDPRDEEVAFQADDERLNGFRNVLVTDDGTAYLAAAGGRLLVYEPGADELRMSPERLPGGRLRASTHPAPDRTVYGVTEKPEHLFALRPDGSIDDLGGARGYTASIAVDPKGERLFYVPGAHGDSWEQGTPLIAVDTETGEQEIIVELNDVVGRELDLTLGGSYSVAVDPSGDRVYVGLNAGRDREEPWGEVVLAVVELT